MTEYLAVRRHPNGGFAVVRADTLDNTIQEVDAAYHVMIGTLRLAQLAAYDEAIALGDIGTTVLPECYDSTHRYAI